MRIRLHRGFEEDGRQAGASAGPHPGVLPAAGEFHAPEVGEPVSGNLRKPTSGLRQLAHPNPSAGLVSVFLEPFKFPPPQAGLVSQLATLRSL